MQKLLFCCLFSLFNLFNCEELSFELPDKEQMCFHDILIKGVSYFLEYQVIEGGNYDINVLVRKPDGSVEYAAEKKQYDRYQFISQFDGLHELCFDNTFSTYSHKFVYFEFSKENNDEDITEGESPMTQLESSMKSARKHLSAVRDYQTHHRLKESQGRSFAENLNERVQYWSIGQTFFILVAGIGQLLVLKGLFQDKKQTKSTT